jgi:hypothetical protein
LPSELQQAIDHPIAGIRAGAVQELARLMRSQHAGLALAARLALERLADDDSRAVIAAATEALAAGPTQQAVRPEPQVRVPEQQAAPQTVATPRREPAVHRAQVPPQPTPAEPIRHRPSTAMMPRHHPGRTTPTTRARTRWWPGTIRGRVIVTALAAAALLVGGVVTWKMLDQAAHSMTIPASFDGQWQDTDSRAGFTATLSKDLQQGHLSGGLSCYDGQLTVKDATDSRLTMRFTPVRAECNPWTVVFTHISGGALKMVVDPDSADPDSRVPELGFDVRMTRQG